MPVCPVCKTEEKEENYIETYTSSFNNQEYRLYHCKNCDLQWWEPLKIIPEFYEQEGEEAYSIFHMGINERIGVNHRMFFEYIPVRSGRLLDVGCGDCVSLKEAQKAGYEVWGIDFDKKSIEACRQKRGLRNVFAMTPQEFAEFCEKEGIKFDVITFFEVLEHQDDPVGFLETIKKMLKPGGWIAGSVPNRESWLHNKFYREIRRQVDNPPHHFLRFNKHSLIKSLEKTGFTNIFVHDTPLNVGETVSYIQVMLTGNYINEKLRTLTLGNKYSGEGTTLYRGSPLLRRTIFKTMKVMRFMVLFVPALILKMKSQGIHLYFQAGLKNGAVYDA